MEVTVEASFCARPLARASLVLKKLRVHLRSFTPFLLPRMVLDHLFTPSLGLKA